MKVVELPLRKLRKAPWNANTMSPNLLVKLKRSVRQFGAVENLVVRPQPDGAYEVIGGNQRLKVFRELGLREAPCVVVKLDDAHARLLAQALNHLHGEDDLGLRAELLRNVLREVPQDEVLGLLPETAESLNALTSLGQQDMADYLRAYEAAQAARLKHLQFQLTPAQLEVVEEALERVLPTAKAAKGDNPNVRGRALYLLCHDYLQRKAPA